jgi:hypothetical protein
MKTILISESPVSVAVLQHLSFTANNPHTDILVLHTTKPIAAVENTYKQEHTSSQHTVMAFDVLTLLDDELHQQ